MKRFNKKDVFTVLNAADAEEHLKMKGYFAESLSNLQKNITDGVTDTLEAIEYDNVWCFSTPTDNFPLFLPASKVIKPEKKYRPFRDIQEFLKLYKVGQVVHLRNKKNNIEQLSLIIAIFFDCYCCVCLGLTASALPLKELFEEYEIKINNEWQPFGVAEE